MGFLSLQVNETCLSLPSPSFRAGVTEIWSEQGDLGDNSVGKMLVCLLGHRGYILGWDRFPFITTPYKPPLEPTQLPSSE